MKKAPFLVAEISANHCGKLSLAKKLINCAKLNGADAVKLQTYTADTMTINSNHKSFIVKDGLWKGYKLWDLYNEAPSVTEIRDYIGQNHGVARWMDSRGGQGPVVKMLSDELQAIQPQAKGLINHFQHEHEDYHELISYCIDNDIPIKSIGIQAHMQEDSNIWSEEVMWNLLEDYSKYDIPIDLTEVTICSCETVADWKEMRAWQDSIKEARRAGKEKPKRQTSSKYEKYQAEYAHDFYTLAFSHPAVKTIVLWALSDKGSWREFPAGVFDDKGKPKPIYHTLNKLIKNKWHTHAKGKIIVDGQVPVRGFYGTYLLKIKHQNKSYTTSFDLIENLDESIKIYL